jgi:putative RNA 2'-phosphotransferase
MFLIIFNSRMEKNRRRTNISKFMSLVLRHSPEKFGLNLDSKGFVSLDRFFEVLKKRFSEIELPDIQEIVNSCSKERFEIKGDKIRARYGHSIKIDLDLKSCQPPQFLYHGTSPRSGERIKREGLKPMKRDHVHLSKTINDAIKVGKRRSKNPLVFKILATKAQKEGIQFYDRGSVVLVKYLPHKFLESMKT